MPNSSKRFVVMSTHNRTEDKWFIASIVAIIVLAASLLYWQNHSKAAPVSLLPEQVNPLINQLSNAAEEIAFFISSESLPASPTLVQLQQALISPFDTREFRVLALGCFVTHEAGYEVALLLTAKGHDIAWRAQPKPHQAHNNSADHNNTAEHHAHNDSPELCLQAEQGWQRVTNNASAAAATPAR